MTTAAAKPLGDEVKAPTAALVVESHRLLAETIADGLSAIGCSPIECVTSVDAALDVIDDHDIEIAVIDTDVRGQSTEPVLTALDSKDIAHVVASFDGCNPLPGHAPYLQKPFSFFQLTVAVNQAREQASVRSWNRVH